MTNASRDRRDIREDAIRYTMTVLRSATDWQEGQHALANHPKFGPWLNVEDDSLGGLEEAQSIIHEAEERLGDELPY